MRDSTALLLVIPSVTFRNVPSSYSALTVVSWLLSLVSVLSFSPVLESLRVMASPLKATVIGEEKREEDVKLQSASEDGLRQRELYKCRRTILNDPRDRSR